MEQGVVDTVTLKGISVDTWDEIEKAMEAYEAGKYFKKLQEYLKKLEEGR